MKNGFALAAIAASLTISGAGLVGCQNSNNPDNPPPTYNGGMTGGGSTDSYGTGALMPDIARWKHRNWFWKWAQAYIRRRGRPSSARRTSASPRRWRRNGRERPAPGQTPLPPGGSTGGTGGAVAIRTYNSGTGGQQTPPPSPGANTGAAPTGNAGSILGGTSGNGSTASH